VIYQRYEISLHHLPEKTGTTNKANNVGKSTILEETLGIKTDSKYEIILGNKQVIFKYIARRF
jgi:hypothetical protein